MESLGLQFKGTREMGLLLGLLLAVVAILVAVGAWHLARRRWYAGAMSLAAAGGPMLAGLLLVSGIVRRIRGQGKSGSAFIGAAAVAASFIVAIIIYSSTGQPETQRMMFWMLALAFWVALAVGVFYTSVYANLGTQRMAVLMVLRCLAIASLMVILFKPAMSYVFTPDVKPPPHLLILVDRSGSMSVTDNPNDPTNRYMQAIQQLRYENERIEKHFRPRYMHFAQNVDQAENLTQLAQLEPKGEGTEGTNVAAALDRIVQGQSRENAPYILLFTDGLHNAPANLIDAVHRANRPIFVAGLGSTDKDAQSGRRNLAITRVDAPMEATRNNTTTIMATVHGVKVPDEDVEVRLIDSETEQTLASDRRRLGPDGFGRFELKYIPTDAKPGTTTAPADPAAPTGEKSSNQAELKKLKVVVTPIRDEMTEDDNVFDLHILVTNQRTRVLYIEGTIRAGEFKWLKRAMQMNPNVRFTGMVLTQRNPATFTVQDDNVGGGPPLAGLPVSDADFKQFDVIIIGDLDRTFWTNRQLDQIAQWVNNGGGLMMIGGTNSFGPGGYGGTKVEEVLPVTVGNRNMPQENTAFIPRLTAEGQSHEIFKDITGFFHGPDNSPPDPSLHKLPPLSGCVTVVGIKTGATLLAFHPTRRNAGGPLVALAVQQIGAGRSAAWTADTTWRWQMEFAAQDKEREGPYARFWAQTIGYLANEDIKTRNAGTHAMLRLDRTYIERGQTVNVQAKVIAPRETNAPSGESTGPELKVFAHIIPDDNPDLVRKSDSLVLDENGLYRVSNNWLLDNLPTEGGYTFKVSVVDAMNTELAEDSIKVTMAPYRLEMDRTDADVAALDKIATLSRGIYRDATRLSDLMDEMLRNRPIDINLGPKNKDVPYYNFPLLFLAFVALITGEWLLRRKWQLQ